MHVSNYRHVKNVNNYAIFSLNVVTFSKLMQFCNKNGCKIFRKNDDNYRFMTEIGSVTCSK